ncbi:MAG: RNA-binding protein [Candidatus Calescibacterium sp.]|nr:RNA-binding protein [Candidatus Calescibacterium sp.]MDW8132149.1 RNA-binding protein [Candidatus Calescibacterium sp.]
MTKLFVGNLSYQLTEDELRQTFQGYGSIKELRLLQSKGFGFVEFESSESAQKALEELNGKELKGRKMRVEMAKPREEKEPREGSRFRQYSGPSRGPRGSRAGGRPQRTGFSRRRED